MRIYVGTSGWSYSWNPDGLKWYVHHSGFNAVELNMSFYSFPRVKQVERWVAEGSELRWVIKVHRSITHLRKLKPVSIDTWRRFRERFKPLEESIDFYLFQLPPSIVFGEEIINRIKVYSKICDKIAIEPRHKSWFKPDIEEVFEELGVCLVTPDSPLYEGLPGGRVYKTRGTVYVRMHGRLTWYNYGYLEEELEEVAKKSLSTNAKRIYIFFNNNHDMLNDGRRILEIFRKLTS